ARAEADRLRALAAQPAHETAGAPATGAPVVPRQALAPSAAAAPAPSASGQVLAPAAAPSHTVDEGESLLDVEGHPSVAHAELELRTVEQAILDLADGNTDGWRRLMADGTSPTESSESSTVDDLESDEPEDDDDSDGGVSWRDSEDPASGGWSMPTLDRVPG